MWLLIEAVFKTLERVRQTVIPNAEQMERFEARASGGSGEFGGIMTIAGSTARVSIKGILTPKPDFFAAFFGGGNTVYSDIISALNDADADKSIESIELDIDSPGGSINGMFKAIDTMRSVKKPITARVTGQAASAAYALASQADKILAEDKATSFGCIGIMVDIETDENSVQIASTKAPKKAPDVKTEEGKAIVREQLDEMHALFVEEIAKGRNTTTKDVNANYGEGSVLLAQEAIKRGMIDGFVSSSNTDSINARNDDGGRKPEDGIMDLNELKAKHPDVYAAAKAEGKEGNRKRVLAHLKMGKGFNAMDIAIKAIEDDKGFDEETQAEYLVARANNQTLGAFATETEASAADTVNTTDTQEDEKIKDKKASANIMTQAAAMCGVELEGVA